MLEKIAEILRSYKEDEGLHITADTTFEELGLDSLDIVELVMKFEDEFSVTIEMDAAIRSVGELMDTVEKAQNAGG